MLPFNFTYFHNFKIIFSAKLSRNCKLPGAKLPGPTDEFKLDEVSTIIGTYMDSHTIKWVSYLNTYKLNNQNRKPLYSKPYQKCLTVLNNAELFL